jgi:hypothetical protein
MEATWAPKVVSFFLFFSNSVAAEDLARERETPGTIWHASGREGHGPGGMKMFKRKKIK